MKINNAIPERVLASAVAMLQVWIPDLTPTSFVRALRAYGEEFREDSGKADGDACTMKVKDAAARVGCCKLTIYKLIRRGELRAVKIGRNIMRVNADDVARLIGVTDNPDDQSQK